MELVALLLMAVAQVGNPLAPPKTDAQRWQAAVERARTAELQQIEGELARTAEKIKLFRRAKVRKPKERKRSGGRLFRHSDGSLSFEFSNDKRAEIKRLKERLMDLRRQRGILKDATIPFVPRIKCNGLKVGAIGTFDFRGRVLQVLADDEMLVEFKAFRAVTVSRTVTTCDKLVCVRGIAASQFVDGSQFSLVGRIVEVTGTMRYETVIGGTRQVYVVEPFEIPQPQTRSPSP